MAAREDEDAERLARGAWDVVRVGISACLLGEAVRYDGGHKYESFVATLAAHFVLVPTCPEAEIGLGIPREPIHLVSHDGAIRVVADGGADHTETMLGFSARRTAELERAGVSGYVFKKGSPSCGLRAVPVANGGPDARGLFADTLLRSMPALPVAEETELRDRANLDLFIERVLAYHRRARVPP
jgi:uncharacterized protein YbbK (DUF523 family)